MPHKHKRKRDDDDSIHDLAPTSRAKPLSVRPEKGDKGNDKRNDKNQVKKRQVKVTSSSLTYKEDDTPRAFARLMAMRSTGKRVESGLDDGQQTGKKRKRSSGKSEPITSATVTQKVPSTSELKPSSKPTQQHSTTTTTDTTTIIPKILPGESLRDFSARVDNLLPISTAPKSSQPGTKALTRQLGLKDPTTRHNKRLQKLIANWRSEEARLKERRLAAADEGAQDSSDTDYADTDDEKAEAKRQSKQLWSQALSARDKDKKGKKLRAKKRRHALRGGDDKAAGENGSSFSSDSDDDDDDDPWRKLNAKKLAETKQRGPQDVVQAPPTLNKSISAKFKDVVPKSSYRKDGRSSGGGSRGSREDLKKKQELAKERERFLTEWRKLKGSKR